MSTPTLLNRTTFRQLLSFGVVGGVQYVIDIGTFSCLVLWSGCPIASNLISRALGATCGYYLNGFFTTDGAGYGVTRCRRSGLLGSFTFVEEAVSDVETLDGRGFTS